MATDVIIRFVATLMLDILYTSLLFAVAEGDMRLVLCQLGAIYAILVLYQAHMLNQQQYQQQHQQHQGEDVDEFADAKEDVFSDKVTEDSGDTCEEGNHTGDAEDNGSNAACCNCDKEHDATTLLTAKCSGVGSSADCIKIRSTADCMKTKSTYAGRTQESGETGVDYVDTKTTSSKRTTHDVTRTASERTTHDAGKGVK
jgi:hypothetical protein